MAHAEFNIVGLVGKVTPVGQVVKVRVASEYGRRDPNTGDFNSNTHWNELTIFNQKTIDWATQNLGPGDVVSARGTIKQTSWDDNGKTRFDVLLAVKNIDQLATKAQLAKQ